MVGDAEGQLLKLLQKSSLGRLAFLMVYFQWPIISKFKVSKGIPFSKHLVCLIVPIKSLWINIGIVQDYKLKKLSPPKNNKQTCVHVHRRFLAMWIYVRHIFWKCEHVVFHLHFYLWKSVLKSWLGVIPCNSRQTLSRGTCYYVSRSTGPENPVFSLHIAL